MIDHRIERRGQVGPNSTEINFLVAGALVNKDTFVYYESKLEQEAFHRIRPELSFAQVPSGMITFFNRGIPFTYEPHRLAQAPISGEVSTTKPDEINAYYLQKNSFGETAFYDTFNMYDYWTAKSWLESAFEALGMDNADLRQTLENYIDKSTLLSNAAQKRNTAAKLFLSQMS